jgi:histidine ammonia-lyase
MTVVVGAPEDFTLEAFRRVAVDGEGVVIGPDAVRVMAEARAGFERLLRADPGGFIYGVTTRPGVEVGTAIPPEDLRDYARRFRGVGRGFGRDCLDERVVRGIVFARLADFIGGHAKVRPELAQRVAVLLDGPLPRVPLDGQGGAGEILPLMHVMAAVDAGDLVEGEGMALINGSPCATALAEPVKPFETSGDLNYLCGLLGLDGRAGLVDPYLAGQGRG